jgi:hypothetical protein
MDNPAQRRQRDDKNRAMLKQYRTLRQNRNGIFSRVIEGTQRYMVY